MRYQTSDNSIAELGEFSRLNYEQLESITQAEFHPTYRFINSNSSSSMYFMYLHGDIALVAVLLAFTLLISIMVFITLLVYPDEMLALYS
ncbi:hypothetical protein TSAR_004510 [Trichomalopsis sarcophagae]|uniref:Uncharacterized protein n=1 Tax=Trichomalopsis sarcophagae TaxID=543379 RepID=A0A232EZC9_9HYME|nr:hypothetical protein TSAR_004510 [Trichomalopsis sarcophagae]